MCDNLCGDRVRRVRGAERRHAWEAKGAAARMNLCFVNLIWSEVGIPTVDGNIQATHRDIPGGLPPPGPPARAGGGSGGPI